MAYDEQLAARVRAVIDGPELVEEKRMFGGLAFMVDGAMAVCVSGQGGLMVRVDAADHPALLEDEHVAAMVMGGRASRTWVVVDPAALVDDDVLRAWTDRGRATVAGLSRAGR